MRRFLWLAAACVLTAFFVSPLLAEDFLIPDFRGDSLSYTAYWEFTNYPGDGVIDIPPDVIVFQGDGGAHDLFTAWTHAEFDPVFVSWHQDGYMFTGDAPGWLGFFLNNWVDPYVYKHIWIQVTYSCDQGAPFVTDVLGADESGQWPTPYVGYPVNRIDVDSNHFVEYWQIQPNPNMEWIYLYLPPNCQVDEVVIDTWSTDSPVDNEAKSWGEVKSLYR